MALSLCHGQSSSTFSVITGAERMDQYLPMLEGKKVGLLVNHTSTIGSTHLLDTLISRQVNVVRIFAPEHGFRGEMANGETVLRW
ncbi:exo-beta-N-acetylmuramidase NamZ domain-containing protein [Reichenbachiella ulvae]|uniref:DUF1343 domain-containing protein n=1 Tax=Reichenbachiella ulvae TaxID=2980104 RepID=A0ABT3CRR6_9BACT|nr:exo-beta-N-acetylmuramidase NamZ domain-containing protein [Reichenbachiella ulvae]MCV9386160.1 DUF1343 domain-containing protein [Reichenbachiella ulvae]